MERRLIDTDGWLSEGASVKTLVSTMRGAVLLLKLLVIICLRLGEDYWTGAGRKNVEKMVFAIAMAALVDISCRSKICVA